MNTNEYVKSLFRDYEETEGLKDFMEELQSNLDARISSLVQKGLPEGEAFDKACSELGDVSNLADELSLKKRREVFEDAYLETRKYMRPGRVAAYVIFALTALFGVIVAVIAYFSMGMTADWRGGNWGHGWGGMEMNGPWAARGGLGLDRVALFGALMPFVVTSIAGFTFLGLTQETSSHFPMSGKRAAWYTVAASMLGFGFFLVFLTYFSIKFSGVPFEMVAAAGVLIPFALPGGGLLTFLILTEKSRLKPWAAALHGDAAKRNLEIWEHPAAASRFRLFSAAVWIFAFGFFILFGFIAGFAYSWLAFFFAVPVQLLIRAFMLKKK